MNTGGDWKDLFGPSFSMCKKFDCKKCCSNTPRFFSWLQATRDLSWKSPGKYQWCGQIGDTAVTCNMYPLS